MERIVGRIAEDAVADNFPVSGVVNLSSQRGKAYSAALRAASRVLRGAKDADDIRDLAEEARAAARDAVETVVDRIPAEALSRR